MSFNRVIIAGNLGKDPVDLSKGDSSIAAFSIATHETTSFSGKTERTTEWFDVVCFGKDAEFSIKNLKKGSMVLIEGKLQSRTYSTKDNTKVKTFEIKASTVQGLNRGSNVTSDKTSSVTSSKLESAVSPAPQTITPSTEPRGASMLAQAIGEEDLGALMQDVDTEMSA